MVDTKISGIIGNTPEALNTLIEIANALDDDHNYAGTITNQFSNKQGIVANVDDTKIGYLSGVTSDIQTQLDAKLLSSTAATTYQAIVADVNDTKIGYLSGVTSDIQTQLYAKLLSSTAATTYQAIVTDVNNTKIGFLSDVTDNIQSQINNILPSQSIHFGKYLITDGINLIWDTVSSSTGSSWTEIDISSYTYAQLAGIGNTPSSGATDGIYNELIQIRQQRPELIENLVGM